MRVLERFSFAEVPAERADEVVSKVNGQNVDSTTGGSQEMSQATLHTNHGPITVEFFDEDAPKTVENFRKLAGDGFYDGLDLPPRDHATS